jgi:hypothetical protein
MYRLVCRALLMFLLAAACPPAVRAQDMARTVDELRLLVKAGDTVRVTDVSGREVSGRILTLAPQSIELRVDGQSRRWDEADIASVSYRRPDSLANGAWWGFGIGAGLMVTAVAVAGVEDGEEGWAALAVAFYGGVGAGIGTGIDALIKKRRVIYQKAAATTGWRVEPIATPHARGARLRVRF